jgi:hypothetical protein
MLESLINSDGRPTLQKIDRWKAYKICKAYQISFPKDAPLSTMVKIIAGAGIDVTKPLPNGEPNEWISLPVMDPRTNAPIGVNMIPKPVVNKTAALNIDYQAEIEKRAKRESDLTKENENLAEKVARLEAMVKDLTKPKRPYRRKVKNGSNPA